MNWLLATQSALKGYGLFSFGRYATSFQDRSTAYLNLFLQISITYFHLRKDSLLTGALLDRTVIVSSLVAATSFTAFAIQEYLGVDKWVPSLLVAPIEYVAEKVSSIADAILILHIGIEVVFRQRFHTLFMITPLITRRAPEFLKPVDEAISQIAWWLVFPYNLGVPGAVWETVSFLEISE